MSSTGDRTYKAVSGALRDCINSHGPISEEWVESATKRVVSQLRQASEQVAIYDPDSPFLNRAALDAAYKRLDKLRYGHQRLIEQYQALRSKYQDLLHERTVEVAS